MAWAWPRRGLPLALPWPRHGLRGLGVALPWPALGLPMLGHGLAMAWALPCRWLAHAWAWPRRGLAKACPWPRRGLAMCWHWLANTWAWHWHWPAHGLLWPCHWPAHGLLWPCHWLAFGGGALWAKPMSPPIYGNFGQYATIGRMCSSDILRGRQGMALPWPRRGLGLAAMALPWLANYGAWSLVLPLMLPTACPFWCLVPCVAFRCCLGLAIALPWPCHGLALACLPWPSLGLAMAFHLLAFG